MLNAEPGADSDLYIIRRRGLAAWIRQCGAEPRPEVVHADHRPVFSTTHNLSPATTDLTRLLAGIVVALTTEPVHGHG